jgi:hypothetical protein
VKYLHTKRQLKEGLAALSQIVPAQKTPRKHWLLPLLLTLLPQSGKEKPVETVASFQRAQALSSIRYTLIVATKAFYFK